MQRQFLTYKKLNKAQAEHEISKKYYEKQDEKLKVAEQHENKIRQLESVEQFLVEQLGKTQKTQ